MSDSRSSELKAPIDEFWSAVKRSSDPTTSSLGEVGLQRLAQSLVRSGVRVSTINNRRYLGNKHGLTGFIRETIDSSCPNVVSFIDIFSGTGAVANAFSDKHLITNDILYSNYLSSKCWFSPEPYRPNVIVDAINSLNAVETSADNYVRRNFANTYFGADECSKIGVARELIEEAHVKSLVNDREFAILVTSVLYGMDKVANTVGHYDAYRKNATYDKPLVFPVLLPSGDLSKENVAFNTDANELIGKLEGDLLYCDPPYNSRQYSDAYHLLENIARWEQPEVHGVARKMDRSAIKSAYNTVRAADAFRDLVAKAKVKYIVLSYNNMASKGNGRSNAKMTDDEIMSILSEKGDVQVYEKPHRAFSAGKTAIDDNSERLFVCRVRPKAKLDTATVYSPINYIGGKGKLIPQLKPLLPSVDTFVDLFAGGCNVGVNAQAQRVIFNDLNPQLVELMEFLASEDPRTVLAQVDEVVNDYGFSSTYENSYKFYGADSSAGLASFNREPFLRLRERYNKTPIAARDPLLLYVLVIHGFNNQIRFNAKGEFNLPVGKRDFNSQMRKKLLGFHRRVSEMDYSFRVGDFRDFEIGSTPMDTVFYCDPPYLITQATYNERGGWSERDERDLLHFLERVHSSGRKFALSNVMEAKGAVNRILAEWSTFPDFRTHKLEMSYRNANYRRRHKSSATLEVLITNF